MGPMGGPPPQGMPDGMFPGGFYNGPRAGPQPGPSQSNQASPIPGFLILNKAKKSILKKFYKNHVDCGPKKFFSNFKTSQKRQKKQFYRFSGLGIRIWH